MFAATLSATAAEVFTYIGYILLALVGLMIMITVHEFGHYLAGRLLGFKIEEFSIGFGPAFFKRKSKKTGQLFALRMLPLGGYCAFQPWKRLIVLFSGALFNFVGAIIIVTVYFTAYGQLLPVVTDTFALAGGESNGFIAGDAVLAVDGKQVNIMTQDDYEAVFDGLKDGTEVKVLRDGKAVTITVRTGDYTIPADKTDSGEAEDYTGIGIRYGLGQVKLGFFRSLGRSFGFSFFIVFKVLASLGALLTGKLGLEAAGGTVTVIKTMADLSAGGFGNFMYIMAIISANLAIMNLLPIPSLDGSRMVFTLIEMIFRKPVPRKVEAVIHAVGLALLIILAVFLDIFHLVHT